MAAALTAFVVLCLGASAFSAKATFHAVTASLLLDPFGDFSAVRFPTWQDATPLRYPDRLLTIDGRPLRNRNAPPNEKVFEQTQAALSNAFETGQTEVLATFEHEGKPLALVRPLRRMGANEVAFFFGFYALVALATFTSGILVFLGATKRDAANAYGVWTLGVTLFLTSFFDYHSVARLTPLFNFGAAFTNIGFLWLAWSFPAPPKKPLNVVRSLLLVLTAVFLLMAALLSLSHYVPLDVRGLRIAMSAVTPACLLTLVITLLIRVALATGEERTPLRSAAYGLVVIPALLSLGFVLNMLLGKASLQLLLPLLTPLIPLAIAYSIARHDLLQTEAVLTRKLAFLPVLFFALSAGLFVWLALRYASTSNSMRWSDPVFIGLIVVIVVATLGHRLINRLFFRATEAYRPTIDELTEHISTLKDEVKISAELSRLLATWLPLDSAAVFSAEEVENDGGLSAEERETLRLGKHVRTAETFWVPMRFHGKLTGTFRLGRKEGGALFTSADLELLQTMAALGGVALHHAAALREVDSLRKSQVYAARDERAGVLDTMSAEIAHELGHPLRYFRALFQDRAADAPLDQDELKFAQYEVERMDRMRRTLETLEQAPPAKEPLALIKPVEHVRFLLQDEIAQNNVQVTISVDEGIFVLADHAPLVQVLANLLRNAIQAAGPLGKVGISARKVDSGLVIEVWDNGPGISDDVRPTLFHVWGITTRKGGKGLGLMVCSRIVQKLHWTIDFAREDNATFFRITVPTADLVNHEAPAC